MFAGKLRLTVYIALNVGKQWRVGWQHGKKSLLSQSMRHNETPWMHLGDRKGLRSAQVQLQLHQHSLQQDILAHLLFFRGLQELLRGINIGRKKDTEGSA